MEQRLGSNQKRTHASSRAKYYAEADYPVLRSYFRHFPWARILSPWRSGGPATSKVQLVLLLCYTVRLKC